MYVAQLGHNMLRRYKVLTNITVHIRNENNSNKGELQEIQKQENVMRKKVGPTWMQSVAVGKLTKGNPRFDIKVFGALSRLYYKVNRLR